MKDRHTLKWKGKKKMTKRRRRKSNASTHQALLFLALATNFFQFTLTAFFLLPLLLLLQLTFEAL